MENIRRRWRFVGAALLLSISAAACGPKGTFTPYTDGSFLAKGTPEQAALSLTIDPPNGLFHLPRYGLALDFTDSARRHQIRLGFIMDGQFEQPAKDLARLTCACSDGLTIATDDPLLQALADRVSISLHYKPESRPTSKEVITVEHAYELELKLYDRDGRVVGEFAQRLIDHTERRLIGLPEPRDSSAPPPEATSPAAVFEWLSRNAGGPPAPAAQ